MIGDALTELTADAWRSRFKTVLDPHGVEHEEALDVPPETGLAKLRRRLQSWYREHAGVDRVMVRVNGLEIGVATRALVMRDRGHLGDDPSAAVGPGSSDGASLPGFPAEFRAIRYECGEQACDQAMLRIFYDERDVPECAAHPATRMVYTP